MKKEKEAKNCWDFWKCSAKTRKECPAHQVEMGRECWLVATHFCKPFVKRDFRNCFDCPWYKELNPGK